MGTELGAGALGFGVPGAALAAVPGLAAMSPRLMGEAAYGAGHDAGGLGSLPLRPMGQAAFQFGRNPYSTGP
jgi:hypothetical protein